MKKRTSWKETIHLKKNWLIYLPNRGRWKLALQKLKVQSLILFCQKATAAKNAVNSKMCDLEVTQKLFWYELRWRWRSVFMNTGGWPPVETTVPCYSLWMSPRQQDTDGYYSVLSIIKKKKKRTARITQNPYRQIGQTYKAKLSFRTT